MKADIISSLNKDEVEANRMRASEQTGWSARGERQARERVPGGAGLGEASRSRYALVWERSEFFSRGNFSLPYVEMTLKNIQNQRLVGFVQKADITKTGVS